MRNAVKLTGMEDSGTPRKMRAVLVSVFVLFFFAPAAGLPAAAIAAPQAEADISVPDSRGAALKPVSPKLSRFRQFRDRAPARVMQDVPAPGAGYWANNGSAVSALSFPRQDLYKLQRVYRL